MDPEQPTCTGAPWRWGTDDEMWECWPRGVGGRCPIVTHTEFHTPDVIFHKGGLICALWPLVLHSMVTPEAGKPIPPCVQKGAPQVKWHIWLPSCWHVINLNPRITFMFNTAGSFDGKHMQKVEPCNNTTMSSSHREHIFFLLFPPVIQISTYPTWPVVMF